jgi:RNA recognition motif-containing protein
MEHKLFVGNIPFNCSLDNFRNAFKNRKGYIVADLINNSSSRCFGFVVFKDKENIEELLNKNDVFIGDRKLRLTRYNNTNKKESINYIKLSNIPESITSEDIKNEFKNYSEIGKCFIEMDRLNGKYKNTGIIEILDSDIYEKLLKIESIYINDIPIDMKRYINKIDKFDKLDKYDKYDK